MAFQLSPGVNVTEKDLTTIVPAVATTNAGIVGLFKWGPCNKRVLVDSENNLVALFGTPDNDVYEWWFPAANFLGYGNNLQVVRAKVAGMRNANPLGFTGAGSTFGALIENDDYYDVAKVASGAGDTLVNIATTMGGFAARHPGALGNSLQVQICGSYPVSLTAQNGGYTADGVNFDTWTYEDQFNGAPNTSSVIDGLIGSSGNDEFHAVVVDAKGLFTGTPGTLLEKFDSLSFIENIIGGNGSSVNYRDVINAQSKYIFATNTVLYADIFSGATYGATGAFSARPAGSLTGDTETFDGITANTSFGVMVYNFSGGADAPKPTTAAGYKAVGFRQDADADPEGYHLFGDPELVDVNLLIGGPEHSTEASATLTDTVGLELKDIADKRKDCVAFLSVPNKYPLETEQVKKDRAIAYRNNIGSSSYVVIDSGYKYQYDIYNDTYRWVPLCGDIAGLCARTDVNFDPWFSPAGYNRGQVRGVVKLAFNPRQAFRDELYQKNINPVVTFPGEGTILFGDKTAQAKPSAFDRINVRRLFIVLEKAIATASKYSLFEFNDSFTRAQFRSLIDPFLRDVQARRGIIDYKVVCDEKNNTPEVIDSNRFVADIYIKPNRSINFIQLNFVATKTGVSFTEVGA
jgi:phage tail sheath protein FI